VQSAIHLLYTERDDTLLLPVSLFYDIVGAAAAAAAA